MSGATTEDGSVEVSMAILDGASLRIPALLDGPERERMGGFATPRLQDRYLAAHVYLRLVLARHLGVDAAGLRYDRTCEHCDHPTHGRPRLVGHAESFSLSHSERHVLVAVGPGPLGADVEDLARRPVADRVIRRCCTAEEQAWLAGLDPPDRPAAFLTLWTGKEAVAKAVGLGLVLPFATIDALGSGPVVVRPGAAPLATTGLVLAGPAPGEPGAAAAVAASPGRAVVAGPLDEGRWTVSRRRVSPS